MQKSTISTLPIELLQHIASHANSTRDIVSLSLTDRALHSALSSGTVFELRIRTRGWDTARWEAGALKLAQGSATTVTSNQLASSSMLMPEPNSPSAASRILLTYWRRASALHDRATWLLGEATHPSSGFFYPQNTPPFSLRTLQTWYPRWCFTGWGTMLIDCGVDPRPTLDPLLEGGELINGERVFSWFLRFAEVFRPLLTQNESRNIKQLIASKYASIWCTVLRTFLAVHAERQLLHVPPTLPAIHGQAVKFALAATSFALFILSADRPTLDAIFQPISPYVWATLYSRTNRLIPHVNIYAAIFSPGLPLAPLSESDLTTAITLARRYTACIAIVITTYLLLSHQHIPTDTLSPPVFPRHALSSPGKVLMSNVREWGGYTMHVHQPDADARDPPMFLSLAALVENGLEAFFGQGTDVEGTFTLRGRLNMKTGAFIAHKTYDDDGEEEPIQWMGFCGPWGLAGMWGTPMLRGPLWIWPRAWSEKQ